MPAESGEFSFRPAFWEALGKWRPAIIAGGGFGLAFGWVWFAGLSARVFAALPKIFSGTLLSGGGVSAFCIFLGAGLVINGFLARRAASRPRRRAAWLLHGEALVCMAAAIFASKEGAGFSPQIGPVAAAALLGLAASGPGVFWAARVLRLPPAQAGLALAAAAVFAYAECLAFPFFGAAVLLPAGVVLATGLSLAASGGARPQCRKTFMPVQPSSPGAGAAARTEKAGEPRRTRLQLVTPLVSLAFSFFALGLMAPAAPAPHGADLPPAALGAALAAASCRRLRPQALGAALLAAGAVFAAMPQLAFFPALSGPAPFLWGFAEGAAFVGVASLTDGDETSVRPADFRRAALYLAAVLALVNLGGAAGAAITRNGEAGVWLFRFACAALCPPVLLALAKRRELFGGKNFPQAAQAEARPEEPANTSPGLAPPASPVAPSASAASPATLWPTLTPREQAVAELLIKDMTNPEVCAALFVSENTVRTHIKNLYHKTGAANREDLKQLLRSKTRGGE